MITTGYAYNNKTVTEPELECLGKYIVDNGISKILEFGSGISSHYLGTLAEVVSLEDDMIWLRDTETLKEKFGPSNYKVMLWSGRDSIPIEAETQFDMIFIDGPVGTAMHTYGRTGAFKVARRKVEGGTKAVWMHDAWEHHCIDLAVRYLAPICVQKAYPFWPRPNAYFLGASMLLWEPVK